MIDVVKLAQDLIRCPSITPVDAGALSVLEKVLTPLGFICHRVPFGNSEQRVDNLFAYRKSGEKHIAFAGHTDVVPVGKLSAWKHNPFGGEIENNVLYGRGAVDMKGAIAAFITAIASLLENDKLHHSISLIITGDEEGPAIYGTEKLLLWIKDKGLIPDYCIVGEPTSEYKVGDTLKIGRRGSVNLSLTERGVQGHVAYAEKADNPIPRFLKFLSALDNHVLDRGYQNFPPSNLEITSINVGNKAYNVISAEISANLNIRFNPNHTGDNLVAWIKNQASQYLKNYTILSNISGESFYCPHKDFVSLVQAAVREVTGLMGAAKTTGGTSDARFIHKYCPVIEIGLCHSLAHHVDESAPIEDLNCLTKIYESIVQRF